MNKFTETTLKERLDGFLTHTREALILILEDPTLDLNDKDVFSKILFLATKVCGVSLEEIQMMSETNYTTVMRWVHGHAAPSQVLARRAILCWTKDRLKEMIKKEPKLSLPRS